MAAPSAANSLAEEVVDLMTPSMPSESLEHCVVRCIHGREGAARM